MRINHRITARSDNPFWLEIDYLNLDYKRGDDDNVLGLGISVLNVTENQPQWPEVQRLCALYEGVGPGLANNLFTKRELDSAEWLSIRATGHQGYPKPEADYFERTFDSTSCRRCGIRGGQIAPFRFSGEPKSKTVQFLQFHWVYDEFFVRHAARDILEHEGITGIAFDPVHVSRKGEASQEASQLSVLRTLPRALDVADLQTITCVPNNEESDPRLGAATHAHARRDPLPCCSRVKYWRENGGCLRFSASAFEGAPDVVKSQEWIGSGGMAYRLVLVSQRFRHLVRFHKWRGLAFEPVELVHTPA